MLTAVPSARERLARGRAARRAVPRTEHAAWEPWAERPDPVDLLQQQAAGRVTELVPVHYGRMLASPLAFLRGAAAVMAFDLAGTPSTGVETQLCGDAHVGNFGGFVATGGGVAFSIADFDETLRGPWEWDVKRLATSVEVAGRERGLDARRRRAVVLDTMRAYRLGMRELALLPNLRMWYSRPDDSAVAAVLAPRRRMRPAAAPADCPPGGAPEPDVEAALQELLARYRLRLRADRRRLLDGYRAVRVARSAGCVDRVGRRAWVLALSGRDERDRLLLQIKEAEASVLERYAGVSRYDNHGQRVVEGQCLMEPGADPLLGWLRDTGIDGQPRDFYVRQLRRRTEPDDVCADDLLRRGPLCGWTLAHAHARSGDRLAIAGYLGSGGVFDEALARFAGAYADQNERDHAVLAEAARDQRVPVAAGTSG